MRINEFFAGNPIEGIANQVGAGGGAVLAGHVSGVEHILYADGDALQRAGLGFGRGGTGLGGVEVDEGLDGGITVRDVIKIGDDQRLRAQFAVADQAYRLCCS